MRSWYLSCLLVLLLLGGFHSPAHAAEYRAARVSSVDGSLAVQGVHDDDVSYIEQNAVIRDGDVLWTDRSTQAEIELERSSWVRLAEDTKLEVLRLPPNAEFRLWTGSVYFDLSPALEGPVLLRTPAGDVELERDGVARVDLSSDDKSRVSVFSGRARILDDRGGALTLAAGERAYLDPDRPADGPMRYDRDDLDAFDRYHRARVDYFVSRPIPRELESDILGARELADHGTWLVIEGARYWRPRYVADWRPYSSGYWSFLPGWGYTWIDYAPWGYATSHYGRWLYRPVHGWLWRPTYVWGPAYVSWASHGSYIGWAPLDPWGRPCYVGPGSGFSVAFGTGNIFVDFRSWNFCRDDRFFFARHHRTFHPGHRRPFLDGRHLHLRADNFRMVRDLPREIGVPRSVVRGITVRDRGLPARDHVLRLEQGLPARRRNLIETRFRVPATRDRERLPRRSDLDLVQRDPNARIGDRVARGEEAGPVLDRLLRRQPERQVGGPGNSFTSPRDRRAPGSSPSPERRAEERGPDRGQSRPSGENAGRDQTSPGRRLPGIGERSSEAERPPAERDRVQPRPGEPNRDRSPEAESRTRRDQLFRRDGRSDAAPSPGPAQPRPDGENGRRTPGSDRGTRGVFQRQIEEQRPEPRREERRDVPGRSSGPGTGTPQLPGRTPPPSTGADAPASNRDDRFRRATPTAPGGTAPRYRDFPSRPGTGAGSGTSGGVDRTPARSPETGAGRDRDFRRDALPSGSGRSGDSVTPRSGGTSPTVRPGDSGLRGSPAPSRSPVPASGSYRRSVPGASDRGVSSMPDRRSSTPSRVTTPGSVTPSTSRSPYGVRTDRYASPSNSGTRSSTPPSYTRPSTGSSRGGYGSHTPSRPTPSRGSIGAPSPARQHNGGSGGTRSIFRGGSSRSR